MNRQYRAFLRLFLFFDIIFFPLYRFRCTGGETIPEGPAIICPNHTSNLDPIALCMGLGRKHHPHFMAKVELFKVFFLSTIVKAIGAFPVDRKKGDVGAIKTALKYLKAGEKICIFPEGQRNTTEDIVAKRGAIQIADQMNVPVIPVFIPRHKPPFHAYTITVGKPYFVNPERQKLSKSDYDNLATELMENVARLQPKD